MVTHPIFVAKETRCLSVALMTRPVAGLNVSVTMATGRVLQELLVAKEHLATEMTDERLLVVRRRCVPLLRRCHGDADAASQNSDVKSVARPSSTTRDHTTPANKSTVSEFFCGCVPSNNCREKKLNARCSWLGHTRRAKMADFALSATQG